MVRERVVAELMRWKGMHRGYKRTTVIVVIIIYFGELIEAEVTHPDHTVMVEASTFDDIRGTARTKYLSANATVMLPSPSREQAFAIIALSTILVVHPIVFR